MTRPGRASQATAQPRDSLGWAGAERGDAGALVRVRRDTAGAFPVTKENPFSAWSKFAKHIMLKANLQISQARCNFVQSSVELSLQSLESRLIRVTLF